MDDTKKTAYEHTEPVQASSEASVDEEKAFADPHWNTGIIARFPWLGFSALLTVLLCAASAIVVLEVSNNKIQGHGHWPEKIAPNVILSGLNNLQNICFGIAIGNGIAIAWWRKALKGATISDLHRSWAFGSSFANLVLSGRYFNFIALAALAAKLTIIDGVLLQRATTTGTWTDYNWNHTTSKISGYANYTLPVTGYVSPQTGTSLNLVDSFSRHLWLWSQSGGKLDAGYDTGNFIHCNGQCFPYIEAAGFEVDCNSTTVDINFGQAAQAYRDNLTTTVPVSDLFSVSFDTDYRDGKQQYSDGINYSRIVMRLYSVNATDDEANDANTSSCPGIATQTTCYLRPAVVRYATQLVDYTESLSSGSASSDEQYRDPTYITLPTWEPIDYNYTGSYDPVVRQQTGYAVISYNDVFESHDKLTDGYESQLGGIKEALNNQLSGYANISWAADVGFISTQAGSALTQISQSPTNLTGCGFEYLDTIDILVQQINSLMFSISIDAYSEFGYNISDPALLTKYKDAIEYPEHIHFVTQKPYMWGAFASMLCCVLCVLPTYYGYWQLGRNVTLGPFEIANAFRAPVLDHPQAANAVVNKLIKEVGDRRVKYGEMTTSGDVGRLAIAEPDAVRRVHPSIMSAREEINASIQSAREQVHSRLERVLRGQM